MSKQVYSFILPLATVDFQFKAVGGVQVGLPVLLAVAVTPLFQACTRERSSLSHLGSCSSSFFFFFWQDLMEVCGEQLVRECDLHLKLVGILYSDSRTSLHSVFTCILFTLLNGSWPSFLPYSARLASAHVCFSLNGPVFI